jgi:hypothetical protein
MGNGSSGRPWQRVKRRDRSLGPASEVRKVEVTPELEQAALQALASCGPRRGAAALPGRTLAAGRALAGRGLGYQGKWGIGRARSRPNQQALPTRDRVGHPPPA